MEGGVDVKGRHEAFQGVELQGGHLGRIFVDEPLGEPEAKHGLPLFHLAFFGVSGDHAVEGDGRAVGE